MDARRGLLVVGALTVVMGAVLFFAATGVIPQPDAKFGAPRWVVALFGLAFFFAGFYVVSLCLPAPVTGRVLAAATTLTFLTGSAILVTWLAWTGGGGGRVTVSAGPVALLAPAAAARGLRWTMLWFFAALNDALAAGAWIYYLRALVRRP